MRLARGETPESIIDDYVKENGTASLAIPPNSGVMRSIYAVPIVALVGTGVALAVVLRRWRSNATQSPEHGNKVAAPDAGGGGGGGGGKKTDAPVAGESKKRDAYDDRIDAELKDLDG
jgi:hypothetical protein